MSIMASDAGAFKAATGLFASLDGVWHEIALVPPEPPPPPPVVLPDGLILKLDAATYDGGSQWVDSQSSRAFTMTNAVKKAAASPNGTPAVAGTAGGAWSASTPAFVLGDLEAFLVFKCSGAGYANLLHSFGTSGAQNHWPYSDVIYTDFGSGSRFQRPGAGMVGNWVLVNIRAAGGEWGFWRTGDTSDYTTPHSPIWSNAPHYINGPDGAHEVAEVLFFNKKLAPADNAAVRAYLTAKHGV